MVYLIYAPNGDIYHRTEEFLMDDIQDHMDDGECTVKAWYNDLALDDYRRPLFTVEGNAAIKEWLNQK